MANAAVTTPLRARGALAPYADRLAAVDGPVRLIPLPLTTHLNLRVAPEAGAAEAVAGVLGAALPGVHESVTTAAGLSVHWIGPDEWLVADPSRSAALEGDLRAALGAHGAVTDQSGHFVSLLVDGDARGLLSKGTALDLGPEAFPRGASLQGLLTQAVVLYVNRSEDASRVELVFRTTFARHVAEWLLDAVRDPLAYPATRGV